MQRVSRRSFCTEHAEANETPLTSDSRFLKLGLQGVSIFYASGDDGVAGYDGDGSSNGCLGPKGTIFNPAWPNTYV